MFTAKQIKKKLRALEDADFKRNTTVPGRPRNVTYAILIPDALTEWEKQVQEAKDIGLLVGLTLTLTSAALFVLHYF